MSASIVPWATSLCQPWPSLSLAVSIFVHSLFEAFYSSIKPVSVIQKSETLSGGAKCPNGKTALDFSLELVPESGKVQELLPTPPVL